MTYKFQNVPQFTRYGSYAVDISWRYLEEFTKDHAENYKLNLNPDYQRAHVWNNKQRARYVEYILRGGMYGKDLYLNCPGWNKNVVALGPYELVDGKQRFNAVWMFLHNNLPIFSDGELGNDEPLYYSDFEDRLSILTASFKWHVNDLETRAEVLQWYLDINSGGVVHSEEELARVRALLEEEKKR